MKTKFKKNQNWKFPTKFFKKINHSLIYQPFRKKIWWNWNGNEERRKMTSRNCSWINVCLYGNLWLLWQLKCSFHEYIYEDMKSSSSASISCLHRNVVVADVIFITFYFSLDYRMSELNAFNKFNFTQLSSITATLTHKFLFHYSIIFCNVLPPPLLDGAPFHP